MRRTVRVLCSLMFCSIAAAEAQPGIKVALVQPRLIWGDIEANLKAFNERIDRSEPCDMIVLPELFASGCEMSSEAKQGNDAKQLAADCFEEIEAALLNWAARKEAVVVGSAVYGHEGKFYNRLIAAFPNGSTHYYDKHHCFKRGSFSPGEEPLVFEYKGVRIATYICYDLRFPEWSRNNGRYDTALYIANWPASRRDDWNRLLKERATENHAYIIAVNCVGHDPHGLYYAGDSQLLDPTGSTVVRCQEGKDEICYGRVYCIGGRGGTK